MKHSRKTIIPTTAVAMPTNWKTSVQSKSLLIAIAAFLLTTNSAFAYSGEVLEQAGLSETQRNAFVTARELREHGDIEQARNVLVNAGIDTAVIERVRSIITQRHHSSSTPVIARKTRVPHVMSELTEREQEAFKVAAAANDRDTMTAILEDAGVQNMRSMHNHRLRDGRELQ
jgi:hypothetical protein